ncbi:MAG: polysaccharide deacetylase family protein, partial [Alphaproteobacteria bacterium]|nr:polysaccharide deacetylase family protein [Alphaproteobacteria bacterium]
MLHNLSTYKQINNLTIVMYHYVRDIASSRFPNIAGLEISGFCRQLDYLNSHFEILDMNDVIESILHGSKLPENGCLLTFDDGYKDHIDFVLPELLKRNLTGSFFPPCTVLSNDNILDVNAIHYILASHTDKNALVKELFSYCKEVGISENRLNELWRKNSIASRFDTGEVIFFKRMLQHLLPNEIRKSLIKTFFSVYIDMSPREFANMLYLSMSDVSTLLSEGMFIGSHTANHPWLNTLNYEEQKTEINLSLEFLKMIGAASENWVMCYPYG